MGGGSGSVYWSGKFMGMLHWRITFRPIVISWLQNNRTQNGIGIWQQWDLNSKTKNFGQDPTLPFSSYWLIIGNLKILPRLKDLEVPYDQPVRRKKDKVGSWHKKANLRIAVQIKSVFCRCHRIFWGPPRIPSVTIMELVSVIFHQPSEIQ